MKKNLLLSAFFGIAFAIPIYLICSFDSPEDAITWALFSGLSFCLILSVFLLLHEKFMNKKYSEIEKTISSLFFHKTNGNFNLGNGKVRNGNIYFCETGIVCISLETKPYCKAEIPIQDIERYEFNIIHLNIYTKSGKLFAITLPDAEKTINILKQKEWIH